MIQAHFSPIKFLHKNFSNFSPEKRRIEATKPIIYKPKPFRPKPYQPKKITTNIKNKLRIELVFKMQTPSKYICYRPNHNSVDKMMQQLYYTKCQPGKKICFDLIMLANRQLNNSRNIENQVQLTY